MTSTFSLIQRLTLKYMTSKCIKALQKRSGSIFRHPERVLDKNVPLLQCIRDTEPSVFTRAGGAPHNAPGFNSQFTKTIASNSNR